MNNTFVGHLDLFPIAVAKYRWENHDNIRKQILDIIDRCPNDNK